MVEWWTELFSKVNTDMLISFLREIKLLDEDDLQLLEKEKVAGLDFLFFSGDNFHVCGLKWGPALRLANAAWYIKHKKAEYLPPNTCAVLNRLSQSLGLPSVSFKFIFIYISKFKTVTKIDIAPIAESNSNSNVELNNKHDATPSQYYYDDDKKKEYYYYDYDHKKDDHKKKKEEKGILLNNF
ncbi:hypothetical protein C1645_738428 [Glomus cerebriforme]|uniref:SAM domain-containing protein n=1 Tax=Glomus cerebriforme TaxID=658196 RepID=A0A397T3P7_9GLOM|nr:hypothetical protein C1645_738428 [Glomus cerebriforme]